MKLLVRLLLVVFVIGFVSCRDTKKEEAETEAAIEQIETVEGEVEELSEQLEKDEKELEEALKELDSI